MSLDSTLPFTTSRDSLFLIFQLLIKEPQNLEALEAQCRETPSSVPPPPRKGFQSLVALRPLCAKDTHHGGIENPPGPLLEPACLGEGLAGGTSCLDLREGIEREVLGPSGQRPNGGDFGHRR